MDVREYLLKKTKELTDIPSPTGMTSAASDYVMRELAALGFSPEKTAKGTVLCRLGGEGHPAVLSSHLDTLGLMVRAVKGNGNLRYTKIGGFGDNAVENENVLIHTRSGKVWSGTVQSVHASRHVWGDKTAEARGDETLEIVVDAVTRSKEETEALGIAAGDYVSLEPRFTVTETGFVKSRHLDDKASAAVLLALAREIAAGNVRPGREVTVVFTVYEEIGHGASALYRMNVEDFIAVDMGCVGDDLNCREHQVSICAKDAAGPYDKSLTDELVARAQSRGIDYAVDIYPGYSSDTATALKAGLEARFACCGQGVFASHCYERTHIDGMMATLALVTDVAERAAIL